MRKESQYIRGWSRHNLFLLYRVLWIKTEITFCLVRINPESTETLQALRVPGLRGRPSHSLLTAIPSDFIRVRRSKCLLRDDINSGILGSRGKATDFGKRICFVLNCITTCTATVYRVVFISTARWIRNSSRNFKTSKRKFALRLIISI